jgi:FAD/FMN-containing dehydrogenase
MKRRTFCKTAVAAAVTAGLSACGARQQASDPGAMISAVSMSGEELSIESAAVTEFAESLQGRLFLQGDDGYDAAKLVWNGMFDHKRPSMVAQCVSSDDVIDAVNFARERDLLVSVKCGGHSMPGKSTSDGGMMIDLSQMHSVDVDPDNMTMRADGGSLLGHLDDSASAHNTMTTTGIVSHTGAGGFTLGGGVGRTDRKMGLAIDNLLAATVVTANGDVVGASEDENADLFWGLRGGGGNFGIATEFVYRLHPFNPMVYGGDLFYELTPEFFEFYAELHETLPDEASLEPQLIKDDDGIPVVLVEVVWCGDHAEGEKVLAPLLTFPGFKHGELAPFPYRYIQTRFDGATAHGVHVYLKSSFLKELTPEVIEIIVDYASRDSLAGSWFQHMGGATARVAPDATAFVHRDVAFNFGIMYGAPDGTQDDAGKAAVREYYKAMEPHFAGFYTNLNEDDEKKTWGNYGENYPHLVEVKNKYDPTNLFRLNANIRPSV